MDIEWSEWLECNDQNIFSIRATFGVYRFRLVDGNGAVVPLQRPGGVDDEGILYIGRSGVRGKLDSPKLHVRISNRRDVFASGKYGSAGDENLLLLWEKIHSRLGQTAWVQFQYCMFQTHEPARQAEIQLLREFKRFGEDTKTLWTNRGHALFP